jgi:16S rRNA U1498 N3-methylase RsmE
VAIKPEETGMAKIAELVARDPEVEIVRLNAENARLREALIEARERCGTELHPLIDDALRQ